VAISARASKGSKASHAPEVDAPRCPYPHAEGQVAAHPGAHHVTSGAEAAACPVSGAVSAPARLAGAGDPGEAGAAPGPTRPSWSADAETVVRERAASWSHGDRDRGEALVRGVAEERAAQRQEEITALFLRTLGKKLGYGHPLSERGEELRFTWTPEAEARLADVPEFCRELTRWRVEWTAHKLGLGTTITPREMEVKYELWGRVSHAIQERERDGLPWTDSAVERFSRIPEFVRGQVLEAIEGNARVLGATEVDDRVVDRVIERWIATGDFHEGLYGFR